MADMFISYKSERRAAAQHLARVLELHGYSVWFDYGLYSGRDFGRQIERELQAARAVLVLWCSLSVNSEWVFAEAYKAKDMDKLIPARMEPADIPAPFNVADTIDLESWDGAPRSHQLDRLLSEIARLTGREPVPAFNGLKAYDEQWRGLGALKLAQLPLSAKVQETEARSASLDRDMLDRLRAQAEALEKAASDRQQAEAERHALEARIAAARAQEAQAQAAQTAAQAQPPPPPGLGQKQAEEPAKPGIDIDAWMRGYGRFLAPAGVVAALLIWLLLHLGPWASDGPGGNGEDLTAAAVEAAPAEAAPAALDARSTPASTSAPVVSDPASLPDFALFRDCWDCPEMVVIPAGRFLMGSPASEAGRYDDEDDKAGAGGRQVNVSVPRFAISRFEVTKADYAAFVAATGRADPKVAGNTYCIWRSPGFAQSDRDPVACVNTTDAADYAAWLSRRSGGLYRLPSEAEWEYAARGGVTGAYPWGPNASHDFVNYGKDACCGGGLAVGRDQWVNTAPVGSFPAYPFGLFDMHGNVWEWVEDCYRDNLSGQTAAAYTTSGCSNRVERGGSWDNNPRDLRSAIRARYNPTDRYSNIGFRLARTL